jgi:hypothetical protein
MGAHCVGEVSRRRERRSSPERSAVASPAAAVAPGGSSCSSLKSELADTLEHWWSSPVAA